MTLACRPSVVDAFARFTEPLEGFVLNPYQDVRGLVTVGVGCLIDPVEAALPLPWVGPDGARLPPEEVARQWHALASDKSLKGRTAAYQAQFTTMRLTHASVSDLLDQHLAVNDAFLDRRFGWYRVAPADAQLGVLSMAYAMGPGFQFPKFEAACERGDWVTSARECRIDTTGNPGVAARNNANALLFQNANAVARNGWDPATLYWPVRLTA